MKTSPKEIRDYTDFDIEYYLANELATDERTKLNTLPFPALSTKVSTETISKMLKEYHEKGEEQSQIAIPVKIAEGQGGGSAGIFIKRTKEKTQEEPAQYEACWVDVKGSEIPEHIETMLQESLGIESKNILSTSRYLPEGYARIEAPFVVDILSALSKGEMSLIKGVDGQAKLFKEEGGLSIIESFKRAGDIMEQHLEKHGVPPIATENISVDQQADPKSIEAISSIAVSNPVSETVSNPISFNAIRSGWSVRSFVMAQT